MMCISLSKAWCATNSEEDDINLVMINSVLVQKDFKPRDGAAQIMARVAVKWMYMVKG